MSYNTRTEVFPSSIVANMFGFDEREFFELEEEAQREAPKVDFSS
jgi:LemA protein